MTRNKAPAKLDAGDGTFDVWFAAQFDSDPHPDKSSLELDDEVSAAKSYLAIARAAVCEKRGWVRERTAARYAWNACTDNARRITDGKP